MSNRFLTLVNGALTSTLFSGRFQALENFTAAGVPLYPAGAGSIPAIASPAQLKSAAGLTNFFSTPSGGVVRSNSGTALYTSPYDLSIQGTISETWLEILNSYGANGGAFFGIAGSGVAGDSFGVYNWQGGPIRLFTSPSAASATHSWTFGNNGHLQCAGGVAFKWYPPAGLPAPATSLYGLIATVYDAGASPNIYPAINDNTSWLKMPVLNSAGALILTATTESTSTTTGSLRTDGIGIGGGAISVGKRVQFAAVNAATQPNLSLFVDSATGKLSFKDSTGTVNVLY
jgi:hypothetical protein